jgi:hypothetical protein
MAIQIELDLWLVGWLVDDSFIRRQPEEKHQEAARDIKRNNQRSQPTRKE